MSFSSRSINELHPLIPAHTQRLLRTDIQRLLALGDCIIHHDLSIQQLLAFGDCIIHHELSIQPLLSLGDCIIHHDLSICQRFLPYNGQWMETLGYGNLPRSQSLRWLHQSSQRSVWWWWWLCLRMNVIEPLGVSSLGFGFHLASHMWNSYDSCSWSHLALACPAETPLPNQALRS